MTTRFMVELQYGLREARLLSLAYPEDAEALAVRTLLNSGDEADQVLAVHVLKYLANEGRRESALDVLGKHAEQVDSRRSRLALWALGEADLLGRFRPLYLKKCNEGITEAFDTLSYWADPAAVTALTRFYEDHKQDRPASLAGFAMDAKRRAELLLKSDHAALGKLLSDRESSDWTLWALRVAEQIALPELRVMLRARLDAATQEAGDLNQFSSDDPRSLTLHDPDFDSVLVTYARLGGEVSSWEKAHLRAFGYECDPKERLRELMAERQ